MDENNLQSIWKHSSQISEITINTQMLFKNFKNGMEHRERIVRNRDRKEISIALIVILGFSIVAMEHWFSIASLGMLLIVFSFVYYIYKLRSHRKSKYTQGLFLPINEQLLLQRRFMVGQVRLLSTFLYWAGIPIFSGYMLIIWSLWDPSNYDLSFRAISLIPESVTAKIVYTLIIATVFLYVGWTNRKAARVNWHPLIQQIDELLEQLKK